MADVTNGNTKESNYYYLSKKCRPRGPKASRTQQPHRDSMSLKFVVNYEISG